jgi:hypothetical protein
VAGIAALRTRRECEMSEGYDEHRSDESKVSGSGALMRSRICAASDRSSVVGLEKIIVSPTNLALVAIELTYHKRKSPCHPAVLRRDQMLRVTFPRPV